MGRLEPAARRHEKEHGELVFEKASLNKHSPLRSNFTVFTVQKVQCAMIIIE